MRPQLGSRRASWAERLCLCAFLLARPVLGEAPAAQEGAPEPSPVAEDAPSENAKEAARAVALAGQGKYVEAKALFLEAYRLVPHPIVAYNAALAALALGETAEAAELFDRALAAGEGELSETERATILAARDELFASVGAPPDEKSQEPEPTAPEPPARSAPAPERLSSSSPRGDERPRAPAERPRGSPTLAYVVGAAGAALLLGSGALYLWNDGRYDTWSNENASLERDRDALLAASRSPSQDGDLRRRAAANDERWESIQLVDTATLTMLGAGVVALGVGAYLLMTQDSVTLRHARTRFELAYSF
jgi:tetratricopeptide (TPR) repeat protein